MSRFLFIERAITAKVMIVCMAIIAWVENTTVLVENVLSERYPMMMEVAYIMASKREGARTAICVYVAFFQNWRLI